MRHAARLNAGMTKDQIKDFLAARITRDGLTPTAVPGVQLFRATTSVPCAPAVYEPCVIAIVSGSKEAALDGARFVYDASQYLCCPMTLPVEAGTPTASPEHPLFGVYVSLDPRLMGELAREMDAAGGALRMPRGAPDVQGIKLAAWDTAFWDALVRLLQITEDPVDAAVLGEARLRELYYAVLKGEAGAFARQAFGASNAIARAISHVSDNLDAPMSIDDMAARAKQDFDVLPLPKPEKERTHPAQSTTLQAAAGTAVAGAGGVLTALGKLDPTTQSIVVACACVALVGLGWIAKERIRRWAKGDR